MHHLLTEEKKVNLACTFTYTGTLFTSCPKHPHRKTKLSMRSKLGYSGTTSFIQKKNGKVPRMEVSSEDSKALNDETVDIVFEEKSGDEIRVAAVVKRGADACPVSKAP